MDLGVGFGRGEYDTDQSILEDDQGAAMIRARLSGVADSGIGGGIHISHWLAEGLFEGVGIEPTDLSSLRVFPHLAARFGSDDFSVLARLGPMFQEDELEGQLSTATVGSSTVAIAFGIEPEILLNHGPTTVSLFGSVLVGAGTTDIEVPPITFSADSTLLEVEAGLRVTMDQFRIGLGYMMQRTETDQSDVSNGAVLFGHHYGFDGVLVTAGVSF